MKRNREGWDAFWQERYVNLGREYLMAADRPNVGRGILVTGDRLLDTVIERLDLTIKRVSDATNNVRDFADRAVGNQPAMDTGRDIDEATGRGIVHAANGRLDMLARALDELMSQTARLEII